MSAQGVGGTPRDINKAADVPLSDPLGEQVGNLIDWKKCFFAQMIGFIVTVRCFLLK
jgi:hypothetical protein